MLDMQACKQAGAEHARDAQRGARIFRLNAAEKNEEKRKLGPWSLTTRNRRPRSKALLGTCDEKGATIHASRRDPPASSPRAPSAPIVSLAVLFHPKPPDRPPRSYRMDNSGRDKPCRYLDVFTPRGKPNRPSRYKLHDMPAAASTENAPFAVPGPGVDPSDGEIESRGRGDPPRADRQVGNGVAFWGWVHSTNQQGCLCARALSPCVFTRDLMPGKGVAASHKPVPPKCRHAIVLVENAPEEEREEVVDCCSGLHHGQPPGDIDRRALQVAPPGSAHTGPESHDGRCACFDGGVTVPSLGFARASKMRWTSDDVRIEHRVGPHCTVSCRSLVSFDDTPGARGDTPSTSMTRKPGEDRGQKAQGQEGRRGSAQTKHAASEVDLDLRLPSSEMKTITTIIKPSAQSGAKGPMEHERREAKTKTAHRGSRITSTSRIPRAINGRHVSSRFALQEETEAASRYTQLGANEGAVEREAAHSENRQARSIDGRANASSSARDLQSPRPRRLADHHSQDSRSTSRDLSQTTYPRALDERPPRSHPPTYQALSNRNAFPEPFSKDVRAPLEQRYAPKRAAMRTHAMDWTQIGSRRRLGHRQLHAGQPELNDSTPRSRERARARLRKSGRSPALHVHRAAKRKPRARMGREERGCAGWQGIILPTFASTSTSIPIQPNPIRLDSIRSNPIQSDSI
ncbi:hypothetical protein HETIRDRAFT_453039 [Heterobasidion irregulare TC 32-1]|uniref:Uncharacterized protein n=1 Tax=Heterobasidion irregulare (strain TC 32-1) TaxID=747525 RepID=W4K4R0_HETIT|nr:uncharacterized protein HETIRDRAFT_453039 [Heterobasidion irregulare TC 32-1]ETW80046.1 hypothetical protein HETIRDRAFT_453039 [Heterobasidion irregulare TC 32-1]